jgi:hypothetical protein
MAANVLMKLDALARESACAAEEDDHIHTAHGATGVGTAQGATGAAAAAGKSVERVPSSWHTRDSAAAVQEAYGGAGGRGGGSAAATQAAYERAPPPALLSVRQQQAALAGTPAAAGSLTRASCVWGLKLLVYEVLRY